MKFITKEDEKVLVSAIKKAEMGTSAEIKVHIDTYCKGEPLQEALRWFNKLNMSETEARNGVLIYVAFKDRKLAILGDKGIHELVGDDFWDATYELMKSHFSTGDFVGGLEEAIANVSVQLKHYFPYQEDDVNELSDDISYGN